jgi:hypothetical protein
MLTPLSLPTPDCADVVLFVIVAAASIIGLNLSLMLNTIGFYQAGSYLLFTPNIHDAPRRSHDVLYLSSCLSIIFQLPWPISIVELSSGITQVQWYQEQITA